MREDEGQPRTPKADDPGNDSPLFPALIWSRRRGRVALDSKPAIGPDGTIYIAPLPTGDSGETREAPLFAVSPDGSLKWQFGASAAGNPAVGPDGVVYICNGGIQALRPEDGTSIWSGYGGSPGDDPVVARDGTVYLVGEDTGLFAQGPHNWECRPRHDCWHPPALGADGTIYLGCPESTLKDGALFAITPRGAVRWECLVRGSVVFSPVVAADGTILVLSQEIGLCAVTPDGVMRWTCAAPAMFVTQPVLAGGDADALVLVGGADGLLYAVGLDGVLRWSVRVAEGSLGYATPAVGPDGSIVIDHDRGAITALAPDGTHRWTIREDHWFWRRLAVGSDGTIYYGAGPDRLVARAPDGALRWTFRSPLGLPVLPDPQIGPGGEVYAAFQHGLLCAFDRDGAARWRRLFDLDWADSLTVGTEGTLYLVEGYRALRAIDPDGNIAWTWDSGSSIDARPVVGPGGVLYLSAGDALHKVLPDGTTAWSYATGERCQAALAADGAVAVASEFGQLALLDASGAVRWHRHFGSMRLGVPVVRPDGSVLVLVALGRLLALDANGADDWTFGGSDESEVFRYSHDSVYSGPLLAADGTIIVCTSQMSVGGQFLYHLQALSPDGTVIWRVRLRRGQGGHPRPDLSLGPDGTIYLCSGSDLMAMNADGTGRWTVTTGGVEITTLPAFGPTGRIYFGTTDGLWAIGHGDSSTAAALAPALPLAWPPGDPGEGDPAPPEPAAPRAPTLAELFDPDGDWEAVDEPGGFVEEIPSFGTVSFLDPDHGSIDGYHTEDGGATWRPRALQGRRFAPTDWATIRVGDAAQPHRSGRLPLPTPFDGYTYLPEPGVPYDPEEVQARTERYLAEEDITVLAAPGLLCYLGPLGFATPSVGYAAAYPLRRIRRNPRGGSHGEKGPTAIMRTDDEGRTWRRVGTFPDERMIAALRFPTPEIGYAMGHREAFARTVDGGITWEDGAIAESGEVVTMKLAAFPTTDVGYVAVSGLEYPACTLFRTVDGGLTWQRSGFGTTDQIMDMAFPSSLAGFACGARGLLLRTVDGGAHWERLQSGTREPLLALSFPTVDIGYVVGGKRTALKTVDGGASWRALEVADGADEEQD